MDYHETFEEGQFPAYTVTRKCVGCGRECVSTAHNAICEDCIRRAIEEEARWGDEGPIGYHDDPLCNGDDDAALL